jgi:hypothetical protein
LLHYVRGIELFENYKKLDNEVLPLNKISI